MLTQKTLSGPAFRERQIGRNRPGGGPGFSCRPALTKWVLLVCLLTSLCHRLLGGTVVAWGNNPYGGGPPVPAGLSNVTAIAAGYSQSMALKADGTLALWGSPPALPAGLSNLVGMASGSGHALALRANGTVAAWGDNLLGEANVPPGLLGVVAVSAGFNQSAALKADGTVASWGCNFSGQCPVTPGLSNTVAISCGGYHTLALLTDGTVLNLGSEELVPEPGLSNVVAIAAGGYHNLAVRSDGSVVAWGFTWPGNDYGQTNVPPGISNVIGVAAGVYHNLVLKADRTVQSWGYNYYGQCNVPPGLSNVVSLAGGGFHSLALVEPGAPAPGPKIARQPVAAPVLDGSRVLLSVGAVGAEPLGFQWRRNGADLPDATHAVLELPSVTTNDAGSYSVVVSNLQGVAVSSNAALSVIIPPLITEQPTGATLPQGGTATLSVSALGLPAPGYQWRRNGNPIVGGTNAVLTLTNLQTSQAGTYSAVVSNFGGAVTSSNAALVVDSPPVITKHPTNEAAYLGDAVTFRVTAMGTAPLSYQWRFNGAPLPEATNSTLTLPGLSSHDTGDYSVSITSPFFSVLSSNAMLTVLDGPPLVVAGPTNTTTFPGGLASFAGSFAGSKPFAYQWHFNGRPLAEETNAVLVVANVSSNKTGPYSVAVSNRLGGAFSLEAMLSLVDAAAWGAWESRGNEGRVPIAPLPAFLTNLIAIAEGGSHSLALQADGTVVAWGGPLAVAGQTNVPAGMSNVVAIAAGGSHSLALQAPGLVRAWGLNNYGQANVPVGLSNVVAVAAGWSHSLALQADGTVRAWGHDGSGQTSLPLGLSDVVAIAAGSSHNLALKSDGTVVGWGGNAAGQTTVPAGLSNVVAIAAGSSHSLAVKADGTAVGWGYNLYGQATVPEGLSNVLATAGGFYHSTALQRDGTVVAWGTGSAGQTNIPAGLSNVTAIAANALRSLALVGTGSPATGAPIASPAWNTNGFTVTVPTQSGKVYGLEYQNSLAESNWMALPLVAGTGGTTTLSDPTVTNQPQRFYRVRRW